MKTQYLLLCLFGLLLGYQSNAQRGGGEHGEKRERPKIGTVSGIVIDSLTNEPMQYANISLFFMRDSSLTAGALTDEKGKFKIEEVPVGRYNVKITHIGYNSIQKKLMIRPPDNITHNLGKISMQIDAEILEAAEVTAEKKTFQLGLDRKIFNIDKETLDNSENATDVLRHVPTVEVDPEGSVKMRGSGVQVYINNKPTGITGDNQVEILDALPASTIKSVELITSPSAKYDPEGQAGIINIVLKKNRLEGFTGSVRGSVGTVFNKYKAGLNLNYRSDKINLFSSFNWSMRNNWSRGTLNRKNIFSDTTSYLDQSRDADRGRNSIFGRIGMDWYISDHHTLTLTARVRPGWNSESSDIIYNYSNQDSILTDVDKRSTAGEATRMHMNYNLIYAITFPRKKSKEEQGGNRADNSKGGGGHHGGHWHGKGRSSGGNNGRGSKTKIPELVFDLQYNRNQNEDTDYFYQQLYLPGGEIAPVLPDSQNTVSGTDRHEGIAKIDYTHPFKGGQKLEAGYKGSIRYRLTDFASQTYDFTNLQMYSDTALNNDFRFTEQIHAVYTTYGQKVKKFSFLLGMRLEQTISQSRVIPEVETIYPDSTFNNNYFSWFPSVHLSYELPKAQQLQLTYNRRVTRPNDRHLNPFPSYSDPINLRTGNPFLRPSYHNKIELAYAKYWQKYTITASAFYTHSTGIVDRITTLRTDGVSESTFENFLSSHNYGLEMILYMNPVKWWRMHLSGNVFHRIDDVSNIDEAFSFQGFSGQVSGNTSFTFGKERDWSISMTVWHSFPKPTAQGKTSGYWWTSASVSKSFLKRRLRLSLSVQNPVRDGIYSMEATGPNFYQQSESRWEARVGYLKLSYTFGKLNARNKKPSRAARDNGGGEDDGGGMGGME